MNDVHAEILRALESGSQENRWAATLALEGYAHEKWASEQLEKLLGNPDPFLAEVSARALRRQPADPKFKRGISPGSASRTASKDMSSAIPLEASKQFQFEPVKSMLEQHLSAEPRTPVGGKIPQANAVDRVISVARLLGRDGSVTGTSWQAEISSRQVLYYRDAALWLGLLDDANGNLEYLGAELGVDSGSLFDRFSAISGLLVRSHPVVNKAVCSFLEDGRLPRIGVFTNLLEQLHRDISAQGALPMGPSTAKRRLDTARAWTQWIASRIPTSA